MRINAILLVVYLAGLFAYTSALRARPDTAPPLAALAAIPLHIGLYEGANDFIDEQALSLLGADETLFREYHRQDGPPIWVFLGYFGEPRENSQIHSPKHCYPGSGWSIYGETRVQIAFAGEDIGANCLLITDGNDQQAVFYWFHTDTGIVGNEFELKWVQMKNTLLQRSRRATFVRFSTPITNDDRAGAEQELRDFINVFGPHVTAALSDSREDA